VQHRRRVGHRCGRFGYPSASFRRKPVVKIVSFNANGLRSATSKGFFEWVPGLDADLICIQETKAQEHQLRVPAMLPDGYTAYFRDATTKKGYSGVAIYTRREPDAVLTGIGWDAFDEEGRYLELRFGNLSVVSMYFPSGSSGEERQGFKFECIDRLTPVFDAMLASGRDYVICGDWNIVHTRKDIRNWTSNLKNSGCLPEERAWLDLLFQDRGWVDTYRCLQPDGEDYTWWSQRFGVREKNIGWRIDYQVVTPSLRARLTSCAIFPEPKFSDHAPYLVEYT
jgi:exodeoxyribonuclease-3